MGALLGGTFHVQGRFPAQNWQYLFLLQAALNLGEDSGLGAVLLPQYQARVVLAELHKDHVSLLLHGTAAGYVVVCVADEQDQHRLDGVHEQTVVWQF